MDICILSIGYCVFVLLEIPQSEKLLFQLLLHWQIYKFCVVRMGLKFFKFIQYYFWPIEMSLAYLRFELLLYQRESKVNSSGGSLSLNSFKFLELFLVDNCWLISSGKDVVFIGPLYFGKFSKNRSIRFYKF